MKLTFLGSGGAFVDYRVNYHNNAVLYTSAGIILIDCGTTAVQSLKELGVPPQSVDAVAFTHLHADHASPEMLLWERTYGGKNGPQFARTTLLAPEPILRPLRASLVPFMDDFTNRDGVVASGGVDTVAAWEETTQFGFGNCMFSYFRVPHVVGPNVDKPAYGMLVSDGRNSFYWSGDTTFSPLWIIDAVRFKGASVVFHECMFFPKYPGTVHTHYEELLSLPDYVRARIVLMHYGEVPAGIDPVGDGFQSAAKRHETFEI